MDNVAIQLDVDKGFGARVYRAAKMAHEVGRVYKDSIGEEAGPHFEELDPDQAASILAGVLLVCESELTGFDLDEEDLHTAWADAQIRQGVMDHPNLVPFDELEEEQQAKDTLFLNTVRVALALP